MSTFTTTCPHCGEVSLMAEQIELRVFPDRSGEDFYAFICPCCQTRVRKEADADIGELLRAGGVQPIEGVSHPEALPAGLPSLSHDDLREFQRLLHHDDCLAAHLG